VGAKSLYRFLVGKPGEKMPLGIHKVERRITLSWIVRVDDGWSWLMIVCSGGATVSGLSA
jgi:hypothetical protein